jgi:hypothetical protein
MRTAAFLFTTILSALFNAIAVVGLVLICWGVQ